MSPKASGLEQMQSLEAGADDYLRGDLAPEVLYSKVCLLLRLQAALSSLTSTLGPAKPYTSEVERLVAGTYTLEGRMKGSGLPFWVRMDDGEWLVWGAEKDMAEWAWHAVLDKDRGPPVRFKLAAGHHKLTVSYYNTSGKLDQLKLAKTSDD